MDKRVNQFYLLLCTRYFQNEQINHETPQKKVSVHLKIQNQLHQTQAQPRSNLQQLQFDLQLKIFKMSSQIVKQLKIKTSTVKRLKKQYISYENQTKQIAGKLEQLQMTHPQTEETNIKIRKQKQFLNQSESVLSNVKQKLIQSFEALAQFLSEKAADQAFSQLEEKKVAEEVVLDAETFLENISG